MPTVLHVNGRMADVAVAPSTRGAASPAIYRCNQKDYNNYSPSAEAPKFQIKPGRAVMFGVSAVPVKGG